MTEMEQRLAALEQKCDRILEQLSALLAEIQALYPEVKSPDKHVKEADDTVLDYLDVCQILHISIRQLRRLQQSATCRDSRTDAADTICHLRFQLI